MSRIINDSVLCSILTEIEAELYKSASRVYPLSHLRRTALMVEEAGEALKEALNVTRESHFAAEGHTTPPRRYSESDFLVRLRRELIQTAALAIRQLTEMEIENRRSA